MINQQLLDYIEQQLKQGVAKEQIQDALLKQGWPEQDVNGAFSPEASSEQPAVPVDLSFQHPVQPPVKRPKKILLLVVLIVVGLLIAGGGAFAYFYYFPSPEKVLEKMREKTPGIKSFGFSGNVDSEIKMGDYLKKNGGSKASVPLFSSGKDTKISVKFNGLFDINDAKSPKASMDLNLETDIIPMIKLVIGLKSRVVDKTTYIQFNDLPNLGIFDLSKANNQWIKLDDKSLAGGDGAINYEKQVSEIMKNSELSSEQKEKINSLFKKINYIKITKKLPGEKVSGVSAYHYSYAIDKEGLKQFYIETMKIAKPEMLTEDFTAKLNKNLDILESVAGEIWIGKKDFFPYKVTFALNITETETAPAGKINSVLLLSNFNKPIKVEAPAEFKSLEEISTELFGGLKGFAPAAPIIKSNSSSAADTDKDGLTDKQELAYGTDPKDPDTDHDGLTDKQEAIYHTNPRISDTDEDGFKDGEEVKSGFNPNGDGKIERNPLSDEEFAATPEGKAKLRDIKRINDIQQIQMALEMYYNDFNRYPDSLNTIFSSTIVHNWNTPKIKNPLPNDGNCATNFEYQYNVLDNGQSYELKYCLGDQTIVGQAKTKIKAGDNIARPGVITK